MAFASQATAQSKITRIMTAVVAASMLSPVAAGEGYDNQSFAETGFTVEPSVAALDVREGTWLSLDVSPDGRSVVFDLLGDIYRVPIDGGDAESLTSGHSWDMQPRFSPDGLYIAFTSDRDGGDNIWTLELSTGALHQVSHETFRMPNNPTWSPDGEYIAVRKHYTSSRATGTGQIWLYHARDTTVRPGQKLWAHPSALFQKELGEPMYLPDGSGIYFTQNATPGDTFVYRQDSNRDLFEIRKLNFADGSITTVAGGPGGAARATPSPDGKLLAYVKRVRSKSRLFVHELETGHQRMVYDALDQDMQETWAVHGVYPNMDWTPDSRSIVFWSGGKIRQLFMESGQTRDIEFRVQDTRSVYPVSRFNVDVAPDQFRSRMVRFAHPSPDGRSVVFESLGRLYVKRGNEAPVLLTEKTANGFDYAPVWSPDSRTIYFLRWNDESLTSIRRIAARGGRSSSLQHAKGQYSELAIDAKGRTLAFRKLPGSALLNPEWGGHPGLYTLDIETGETNFAGPRGRNPHFGPENERLYAVERSEQLPGNASSVASTSLISMTRQGLDVRELAVAELATDIRLAPTGRQVLFQLGHHIFIAAIPATGSVNILDAKTPAFPSVRVSGTGGTYPYWSHDGSKITWSVGATLKTVVTQDALNSGFERPDSGIDLSQEFPSDIPGSSVALINARIVTMNEHRDVIPVGTILVKGNRITAIGASSDVPVPDGYDPVDLLGKTVVPGFIDMHAHGPFGQDQIIPQQNWHYLAHLALGVTTVHDPANSANLVFAAAEYARAGRIQSPRIFSTGDIVYGAKGLPYSEVNNLEDALAHARRLKAQGAVSMKNYALPRREQRQQVIEAARQVGLNVIAEGNSLYHTDMNFIVDGIVGIEHNLPTMQIYEDVLQLWRTAKVGYTPTLGVLYGGLTSADYFYQKTDVWKHDILANFVPPQILQAQSVRRPKAPDEDYVDDDAAAIAKQLLDVGVLVNAGAHGVREGLALHWELWTLVRGGFTAMEALSAATINPAKYMGFDNDLGSLETGKLADLVVLNANPLDDIYNTDDIGFIMLNGRLYEAATLAEKHTGEARLRPFYWQDRPQSLIR